MPHRTARAHRALASQSRVALLRALHAADGPLGVEALAAAVGLRTSTTREHLGQLCSAGFLERTPEQRTAPGRPRVLYRIARLGQGSTTAAAAAEDWAHEAQAGCAAATGQDAPAEAWDVAALRWVAELTPGAAVPCACRLAAAAAAARRPEPGTVDVEPRTTH